MLTLPQDLSSRPRLSNYELANILNRQGYGYATSYDGALYAIAPSGQVRWRLATAGKVHARPVVASNGLVLFGSQDDHLYCVRPDGALAWVLPLDADLDSSVTIAADGTLYLAGDDGVLRAFK